MQTINAGYVPEYVFSLLCGCRLEMFRTYSEFWMNKKIKKPWDLKFPKRIMGQRKQYLYNIKDIPVFLEFRRKLKEEYKLIWLEFLMLKGENAKRYKATLLKMGYTEKQVVYRQYQNYYYKMLMEEE